MDTSLFPSDAHQEHHRSKDLQEGEAKIDFIEYWRSITKRKWAILGLALIIATVAAVIVFIMTPIYRSTVTVLINANKAKVVNIDEVYGGFSENRDHFVTQVEILKSPDIALKTIAKLKLWNSPDFDPRIKEKSWRENLLDTVGFSVPVPKEWTDETLARAVLGKFNKSLSVEPVRLSLLVRVSFESTDKELAAKVANTMATVFIETDLDTRFQMTQKVSTWLQERMGSVREKLDASERQLQAYRDKAGIVDVKGLGQSGAGKQIEDVTLKLVETRLRRAEAENAYNQIKNAPKGADLSSLPAVIKNQVVGESIKQVAEAEKRFSEVSQRYGNEHPKHVAGEGELKAARDNLRRQIDTVVQSVTREYEVARGTERMLEGTLSQVKGSIQSTNKNEFQLGLLEREVDSNKQIYDLFLKRTKETNVASDLQNPVARVVDAALVSNAAVKPQKMQIILIAFVLGALLAVGISLLLDFLDNTLKTTVDVEAKLKYPLLTALPLLSKKDAEKTPNARIFVDHPESLYSEAIRTARTGVLLSSIDLKNRVLLVTSSIASEGKTTLSINLAVAHSHTKKTLLIDADMRRPAISKRLDLVPNAIGLSNLVSGTAKFSECVQKIEGTDLHVLPSGTTPLNPLELILSARFKKTLDILSQQYEIIVIDSPPVELVSDALVLAKMVTGVIYVAKAAATPFQLVRKGLMRLNRVGAPILGVVLSHLDFKKAEKYYGDYSGYGYNKYGSEKNGYGTVYSEVYGKADSAS